MKVKNTFFYLSKNLMVLCLWGAALQAQPLDPGQARLDTSEQTLWYDAQLLTLEGQGWTETRFPYDRLPAKAEGVVPEAVWDLGQHSAGISLQFRTDAEEIQVKWTLLNASLAMAHMPATGVSGVDLYAKNEEGTWRFVANGRPRHQSNTAEFDVTPEADLRLYLPLYNGVTSLEIGIPPSRNLIRLNPKLVSSRAESRDEGRGRSRPIIFYGTSITQGGCVSRPGLSVTAIIGRDMDVPTINLGFSGAGKMEAEMAELLSELDPAIYVLDCLWNMDNEMVATRVKPFVRILRKHHPRTPILLVEDSSFENISPTSNGKILRRLYQELKEEGLQHIEFLSNEGMLGKDYEGTVDGVHHNDLGMMRQAEVLEVKLTSMLK